MWVRNRYTGPGGGLYTGPDSNPYMSNWPPREYLLKYLKDNGLIEYLDFLLKHNF